MPSSLPADVSHSTRRGAIAQVSPEAILAADPDVLLCGSVADRENEHRCQTSVGWSENRLGRHLGNCAATVECETSAASSMASPV